MLLAPSTLRARIPTGMIALVLAISGIGIVNLASAAKAIRPNLYLIQLLWLGIGIGLAVIIALIDTRHWRRLSYLFLIGVTILLVATMFVGKTAKGSERWLQLGFIRIQPSELAKLAVVFATARFCADHRSSQAWTIRELLRPLNISRPLAILFGGVFFLLTESLRNRVHFLVGWKLGLVWVGLLVVSVVWILAALWQLRRTGFEITAIIAPVDIIAIPFVIIALQPDLGTALIVLAVFGIMVLFHGVNRGSLVVAAVTGILLIGVAWNFFLLDYQRQRVETFMNPEADIRGSGYHAAQSLIAMGSGKLLGKGFGEGTQTQLSFLPENHTDVAFAVLGEEWGFLGAFLLIILFLALVLSMINVAAKTADPFAMLLVVGCAAIIFCHVVINMGMVIGLLPMVGVTLPFVSYGGASMLTKLAAIAFCINVAVWRRTQ